MSLKLHTTFGAISVTDHCIAVLAGSAALDCYGLVGMVSRKGLKDGIAELLGRENMSRGVEVRRDGEQLHVDLHMIVSYGTKISEVAHNIQSKVLYVLNDVAGLQIDAVHIFVQDVRVSR